MFLHITVISLEFTVIIIISISSRKQQYIISAILYKEIWRQKIYTDTYINSLRWSCTHTCHEGIWGEQRYNSTHSWPLHQSDSGQLHTLATLAPRNTCTYWLNGMLVELQSQSKCFWRLPTLGFESWTTCTTLSWLPYVNLHKWKYCKLELKQVYMCHLKWNTESSILKKTAYRCKGKYCKLNAV